MALSMVGRYMYKQTFTAVKVLAAKLTFILEHVREMFTFNMFDEIEAFIISSATYCALVSFGFVFCHILEQTL